MRLIQQYFVLSKINLYKQAVFIAKRPFFNAIKQEKQRKTQCIILSL